MSVEFKVQLRQKLSYDITVFVKQGCHFQLGIFLCAGYYCEGVYFSHKPSRFQCVNLNTESYKK